MSDMPHPIKLRGRFATAWDTAEALGVSAPRTRELIEAVRKFAQGVADREARNNGFGTRKNARKRKRTGSSTASTITSAPAVRMKKSSGRHAEATKKKIQSRGVQSHSVNAHAVKAHR
jgi:hypothetical protein